MVDLCRRALSTTAPASRTALQRLAGVIEAARGDILALQTAPDDFTPAVHVRPKPGESS